ncbi:hypothetical protein QQS21_011963 [Conoideocrella luteorostrata]|uniref:DUF7703 domain-containing protein n=1 Tax=Conoideocrella luteorostrata TaxID=1105319 RepID=A0AAJ0FT60_9HYPO|nr:hypothetical protein QQS21_011963 [Conoideocrella luteorostrata]
MATTYARDNGSTGMPTNKGVLSGVATFATHMAIGAFTGISLYNVIELNIGIFMCFKSRKGLYFWSMWLATQGVLLESLGFVLKFYDIVPRWEVSCTLTTVGWYLMVTGQSVVLYSRLNLVIEETRIVRGVLVMIVWNAITLHITTTVFTFGSLETGAEKFTRGSRILEIIQMTVFSAQELIISIIYIRGTIRFFRPVYSPHVRSVMMQLLLINVAIIAMDAGLLITEYMNYYAVQMAMKPAVYSVKLKLEFAVLNQLIRLSNPSHGLSFGLVEENARAMAGHEPSIAKPLGFRGWIRMLRCAHHHDRFAGNDINGASSTADMSGRRTARPCSDGDWIENELNMLSAKSSHKYDNGSHAIDVSDNRGVSETDSIQVREPNPAHL